MSAGLVLAGRYRLISKLGQGGMGSVWRAEDMTLGAEVAIKLIDEAFAGSTEALKRFRREAQAAARIRSTYVVQILDHGVDNGTPYIAMELLKGESLAQRLESVGKLSVEQTGRILGHAGRALMLAHEHGIVHRDMKPENVFLVREDEDDVGKVLDFGIARQSGGLADSGGLKTQTGAILGTPYYMSPEQATGQPVDHLTDIWSFGVIASECLTGRRTFDSESLGGLFHAICMAPLPVPSLLGPIPTGFDDWFARAAAREKSARFQSIKEAADSLRALCGRTSGRPSAVSYPNANVRGDTALSSGVTVPEFSAQPAKSVAVAGLQTTSVPSSRSIPGLPAPGRSRAKLLVLAVSVFVIGGLYVGWRWMSQGETTVASSAPPVVSAAAAAGAQSTASSASVTPEPAPVIVEKADAGLSADNSAEHAVVTPQPVRITAPRAAPTKSDKAITRAEPAVPETAKEPPPLATATPPISAPKKRNENAAGI